MRKYGCKNATGRTAVHIKVMESQIKTWMNCCYTHTKQISSWGTYAGVKYSAGPINSLRTDGKHPRLFHLFIFVNNI